MSLPSLLYFSNYITIIISNYISHIAFKNTASESLINPPGFSSNTDKINFANLDLFYCTPFKYRTYTVESVRQL